MNHKFVHWIATCGPIGHLKFAPGTVASLIGVLCALICAQNPIFFAVFLALLFLVAVWTSHITARDLGSKDPSAVVIDEVCGMMLTLIFVPMHWLIVLIGFGLFRFFDIVKPPPVRQLEGLGGGFGIVLDDVMAGIYANVILQLLVRYAHL